MKPIAQPSASASDDHAASRAPCMTAANPPTQDEIDFVFQQTLEQPFKLHNVCGRFPAAWRRGARRWKAALIHSQGVILNVASSGQRSIPSSASARASEKSQPGGMPPL